MDGGYWRTKSQRNQVECEAIKTFQEWLLKVQMGTQRLDDSPSWHWKGSEDRWKGWTQLLKFWHNLFTVEETSDDLSSKWPEGLYTLTWKTRWQKLWENGGLPRTKLWVWKLL
ncbi:hypothetical protein R1flu_014090 [Riccia fluitans]|uniref:Uncharacterized protein n=1 Tax=Riccia fluitans TaxID=41844 RepID=A0ABD1YF44_9MARC